MSEGELEGDYAWRQTDEGIEVMGEKGPRRTKGEPVTLTRIVGTYGELIREACAIVNVPQKLVAGMIAAESLGKPEAERAEPHLGDVSIGLAQTLTATAVHLAHDAPADLQLDPITQTKSLPSGGSLQRWRELLSEPRHAIRLGALYFAVANAQDDLRFDPVLCYAAYNAGSVRVNRDNPWGVHYYRKKLDDGRWADAMDSFSRWYGDACAVYAFC
jgi:soluble lytic murein transglycosylase-like protein